MPEITVIIPTYGIPERLERTVNSVLQQTFKNIELIVVDDNNPDTVERKETSDIMENLLKHDERLRYICHEHNKNGSAARNTGIRAAKGKYISLLDSDDEYTLERLHICIKTLQNCSDPKVQGVYTGCEYRKNNEKYRIMTNVRSGNFIIEYLQLTFNLFTGSNIFISKEAVDALNGFDESFVRHQDVEFMIRFFMKYDIIGIPNVLVIKNFNGNNKPSAKKTEDIKKHFFETFKDTINSLEIRDREKVYAAHYRQLAEQYLLEKKYKKAIHYYKLVRKNHCLTMKFIARAGVYFIRSFKNA
jgi:glycosyltransferase involved in cell wall biosynthesis